MCFSERNTLVADIFPQMQFLNHFINKALSNPRFSGLGSALLAIQKYFTGWFAQYTNNYNAILTTFLDPRYTNKFFNAFDLSESEEHSKSHHTNILRELHEPQGSVKHLQQIEASNDAIIASICNETDEDNPEAATSVSNIIDESLDGMDFDKCIEEIVSRTQVQHQSCMPKV